MPDLNEFLNKKNVQEVIVDDRVETIEQKRPCSKCDLDADSYQFNSKTMEIYWKCSEGHETRYSVG